MDGLIRCELLKLKLMPIIFIFWNVLYSPGMLKYCMPSLSAAVENHYVQPLGQSQSKNGVTVTMEYAIVDRKKVSFFYTLDYDKSLAGSVETEYSFPSLQGWTGTAGDFSRELGELMEIDIDFLEQDVPDTLDLTLGVAVIPL